MDIQLARENQGRKKEKSNTRALARADSQRDRQRERETTDRKTAALAGASWRAVCARWRLDGAVITVISWVSGLLALFVLLSSKGEPETPPRSKKTRRVRRKEPARFSVLN